MIPTTETINHTSRIKISGHEIARALNCATSKAQEEVIGDMLTFLDESCFAAVCRYVEANTK
jgi:hypothetical protein